MTINCLKTVTALNRPGTALETSIRAAKGFAREQHSPTTRRAYKSDFKVFKAWCTSHGVSSYPAEPEVISTFISAQALEGLKASTITRRIAAIRYIHLLGGLEPPTNSEIVRATLKGIRRTLGTSPSQKAAATADLIIKMVQHCPNNLMGFRDKALLLLGFAAALRRSEIVALKVKDIEITQNGMRVRIRKSKTDQEGQGYFIPVLRGERCCPVEAMEKWLKRAGLQNGPVFRPFSRGSKALDRHLTSKSVALIVKKYAKIVGLDPRQFSGHSLRAGFLTSAASNGASVFKMMDISRHKSTNTLRPYVRRAEEFTNHPAKGLL